MTEKVWDYATEYDQPRAFLLNGMDRERSSFERSIEIAARGVQKRNVTPIELPIGAEKNFRGVVDLIGIKALVYASDGDGKARLEEIPVEMAEEAKAAHEALVEMVAEGDDALMQEFFDEGTLPAADLKKGLREAVLAKRIFPVLLGSALHNIGSRRDVEFPGGNFPVAFGARRDFWLPKPPQHNAEEMPIARKVSDAEPVSDFFHVQNDCRPIRRTHHVLQSGFRRGKERRDVE